MSDSAPSEAHALRDLLKGHPTIAWPTVFVALLSVGGWAVSIYAGFQGTLSVGVACASATLFAYWAFTPLHDATHRSLSKNAIINEGFGWLSSVPLLAAFSAFRYMHLTHHKHANNPELDPDYWSGGGRRWTLVPRWLTQDLHYYVIAVRVSRELGVAFMAQTWGFFFLIYCVVAALMVQGYVLETIWLILIPSRLAIALLAATFDWLPHDPHEVESRDDRFRATSILIDPWLTPLFLFQNYHLIHHLYPAVPFYRYARIWELERERLIEHGARVRSVIPGWRVGQPARRALE